MNSISFSFQRAAKRIGKYWKKRVSLFGPEKAFLPMIRSGAFRDDDDLDTMKLGFCQLLPGKDPQGRAVFHFDPSKQYNKKVYKTQESVVRTMWYMMHAALESESAQQKGVIFLVYAKTVPFSKLDPKLDAAIMESLKGCLPIRMSSVQICHPPSFIAYILPILKLLFGERLRKRIKVHSGSNEAVLEKLAKYGMSADMVATEIGGTYKLDQDAFLEARKKAGK